ncbi:MAG: branched chain amino acid aminotransferase, partial [Gammaproteobacteria bacterium]|nr:branched chain amino acid aminotransferase [Gammaproteobacteria bacterium]
RELDGRVIGGGARGPVTEQIQTRYFDAVYGRAAEYGEWLTHV